jgi:hypothetical protein
MTTNGTEDLSVAIQRAIQVCTEYGLVGTAEEFLQDFSDGPRVQELLSSGSEDQAAYGQVLQELREHAHRQAMSEQPVPSMVESGSSHTPSPAGEVEDGAYVEDSAPKDAASSTEPTEEQADASGEESLPEDTGARAALSAKTADILTLLGTVPVPHLRLPPVYAAQISSPALTEEAKELVLRVIAPLMAACGILEVSVSPTYYDPASGADVPLDLENPDDMVTFVRDALRR